MTVQASFLAESAGSDPAIRRYRKPVFKTGAFAIQPTLPAEGAGFEPAGLASSGFRDRRLKPLGHPSQWKTDPTSDSNARPSVRVDNRDAGPVERNPPPVIGVDGIQPCVYRLLAEGKFVQSLLLSRVS